MTSSLQKAKSRYIGTAIIVLNTLLFLLVVNLVLGAAYWIKDRAATRLPVSPVEAEPLSDSGHFYLSGGAVDNGKRSPSNMLVFDFNAYEKTMSELEISRMLDEFYEESQRGNEYQAWVQYGPRIVKGEFLNIELDQNGIAIRHTPNPPVSDEGDLPIEIFTFGGSTTFGAGVPDKHTWPAYLSQILNERAEASGIDACIRVTNYGRVGYYPTQEMHFLLDVLRGGQRPALVLFMDGVNMGRLDDTPDWTGVFQERWEEAQHVSSELPRIPMVRFANSLHERIRSRSAPPRQHPATRFEVSHLVERFKQARQSELVICEQYGIESLFFLQPDAPYNYPARLHRIGERFVTAEARALRERFYREMIKDKGFEDLTGLFAEWGDRKAIVDGAHYSPNFSKFLAEKVADQIDLHELKNRRFGVQTPTGSPRLHR